MNVKSGWKTTEFWFTLLITLLSLGVTIGVVTGAQQDAALEILKELQIHVDSAIVLGTQIFNLVTALIAIFTGGAVTKRYTKKRSDIKMMAMKRQIE
jgi:hypothetical protein